MQASTQDGCRPCKPKLPAWLVPMRTGRQAGIHLRAWTAWVSTAWVCLVRCVPRDMPPLPLHYMHA
eukprot:364252-Chlamydomonas_euryale.AAC.5